MNPKLTALIFAGDWVITTISKHIVAGQALTCGRIVISIDKPPDLRIVITALEIIQPGLYVVGLAMRYNVVLEDALLK